MESVRALGERHLRPSCWDVESPVWRFAQSSWADCVVRNIVRSQQTSRENEKTAIGEGAHQSPLRDVFRALAQHILRWLRTRRSRNDDPSGSGVGLDTRYANLCCKQESASQLDSDNTCCRYCDSTRYRKSFVGSTHKGSA